MAKTTKKIVCEMCGSNDLIKKDGVFECQNCGTKYSIEEAKKMMVEGTVDVKGTVKIDKSDSLNKLYTLARLARDENNSRQAAIYYKNILLENPTDWEAHFFSVYFECMQTKISNMNNSCIKLANNLETMDKMLRSLNEGEENIKNIFLIIYGYVQNYITLIKKNTLKQAQGYSAASSSLEFLSEQSRGIVTLAYTLGCICKKYDLKEEALTSYKVCEPFFRFCNKEVIDLVVKEIQSLEPDYVYQVKSGGCYVATCVYGSYDCPEVWTLRRYRDYILAKTWYGRLFIHTYYAISPTIVKWFGDTKWFKKMWKNKLDKKVTKLQNEGIENTPYEDIKW